MIHSIDSSSPASTAAATPAPSTSVLEEAKKSAQTTPQGQQATRNAQILEASLQVSIQAGNDGLALLYRAAVDEINTLLAPELGPDAIQTAAANQDNSAEATAARIVSLSTAMFERYATHFPDEDMETIATRFVDVIRGGFEQGFQAAHDILSGLGVMEEGSPVAAGIASTYALVQQGYDDWLSQKLASLRNPAPQDTTGTTEHPADHASSGPAASAGA